MDRPSDVPSRSSGRASHGRQIGRNVARTILGLIAVATLTLLSFQSIHAINDESSSGQVRQWDRDAAFWNCLTIQAHSLVAPGERVQINRGGLATAVMLEKVVGGWTILESKADEASAVLVLKSDRSRASCLGSVVVEYPPGSNLHGRPEKIGSGGSDRGSGSLPSTPL
jgi:hypothetical protein